MQRPRRRDIDRPCHDVVELARKLALDVDEHAADKSRRLRAGQGVDPRGGAVRGLSHFLFNGNIAWLGPDRRR
jgi:hypothetical protein